MMGPNAIGLVSTSEGETETQRETHARTRAREDKGRDQGDASISQGAPKMPAIHQELAKRPGPDSPPESSEGSRPADSLILDSRPLEL